MNYSPHGKVVVYISSEIQGIDNPGKEKIRGNELFLIPSPNPNSDLRIRAVGSPGQKISPFIHHLDRFSWAWISPHLINCTRKYPGMELKNRFLPALF
jgi:hypothetical protein